MNSITLFMQTKFLINSWWKLRTKIQGFQKEFGDNLVTEIDIGRIFRVIEGNLNKVNWSKKSRLLSGLSLMPIFELSPDIELK